MEPGTLTLEGACIGIQNSEADDGLSVVYHAPYMHDNLSVSITAQHWLSGLPTGGSIDPFGFAELAVSLDATDLEEGEYTGQVVINSNDPDSPQQAVGVVLDVSSAFVCGDIDNDGEGPNIADLVYLVTYMFQDGPEPPCLEEADINGDEVVPYPDIADLVYMVNYMFQSGPDPVPCP